MSNVNVLLRENLRAVSKNVSVAPDIDEKKLNNAIKAFGYQGAPGTVVAIFDNTLFGSAKEGLLFTGKQLIFRDMFAEPVSLEYGDIKSAAYTEVLTGSKNDSVEASLTLVKNDGSHVSIGKLLSCDYRKLAEILGQILGGDAEHVEEEQFLPLEAMSEALKIAYIQVIVNMAFENDDLVDQAELAEILLLINRISLEPPSRLALRKYMLEPAARVALVDLIGVIDANAPPGQVRSVHVSLVKDLINVHMATGGGLEARFAFLEKHRALLQVSDGEIELARLAIKNDHDLLRTEITDDEIASALKLLSAKAAAVGTPLAAVYLSGSVVGMSAAGLSSGLAALGMGGALGLSSMATGVGVAVLIGVGTYAGVRHLTGANEISRNKRRELMLNEVIKQRQATIALVVEDVNFLSSRLGQLLENLEANHEKVRHLASLVAQLAKAGGVLTDSARDAQRSVARGHCALHLDEAKLKTLTKEPTKAPLFEVIRHSYTSGTVLLEEDGQTREVTRLVLRTDLSQRELEQVEQAFDVVGYFKVSDVVLGAVGDAAQKAKGVLTGLFS